MAKLTGKVALITGAAGSLGSAQARALVAEGATVVLADLIDAPGETLATQLRAQGAHAAYVHLDVTSEAEWQAAIAHIVRHHGVLNVLVNNAGKTVAPARIEERTVEEWDEIMAVNAKSVFLGTKHAIPVMRQAGGGSIINISSLASLGRSKLMEAAYAASKAAVQTFTKVTAAQYGGDNIRCNSVHPGAISNPMMEAYYSTPEARTRRLSLIPLNRFGQPDEVAAAVVFLASDDSGYITGAQLVIDGGTLVQ